MTLCTKCYMPTFDERIAVRSECERHPDWQCVVCRDPRCQDGNCAEVVQWRALAAWALDPRTFPLTPMGGLEASIACRQRAAQAEELVRMRKAGWL